MKNQTGAKIAKKGAIFLVTAAMALGIGAPAAQAAVHPANIIVQEESEVRGQKDWEVDCVEHHFDSVDLYGNPTMDTQKIARCIELSNVLNSYDEDFYTYTNTTPTEVISLNVDDVYKDYMNSLVSGDPNDFGGFIERRMDDKPAIDATIQFSTGILSKEIKQSICDLFVRKAGESLTHYPEVIVDNGCIYVVFGINNQMNIATVDGAHIPGLTELLTELDARYEMITRNLRGYSDEYPNALAYNGTDSISGDSAWLSLGDDDIKEVLNTGLIVADSFKCDETINLDCYYPNYVAFPNEEELNMFARHGYDVSLLAGAPMSQAFISSELDYSLNLK